MPNTYIQDKLDAIENDLKEKGYTKFERETIIDIAKQSLTDYHNHIVEEVNKKVDLDDRGGEYLMGYNSAISDVQQLLQDNPASQDNPKE
jgi:hypothetical protein